MVLCFFLLVLSHPSPHLLVKIFEPLRYAIKEGTPLALAAIGASLVLATGGVDLSSSGVATISGVIFAAMFTGSWLSLFSIILVTVLGATTGAILGWLVHHGAPSLIVSWAIGALLVIIALLTAKSLGNISGIGIDIKNTSFDLWGESGLHGIIECTLLLGLVLLVLQVTNLPKLACALGADRESAVYMGIRTKNVTIFSYMSSGVLAALSGVMLALISSKGLTSDIVGRELTPIAVAVLGGTVMSGGYLSIASVACASILWVMISSGTRNLNLTALGENQQFAANAIFAAVILLVVFFFGRRLSGDTISILRVRSIKEE
jgi:ribose transport system permease protein